jgi:alpha-L-rhamnosidase
VNADLLQPVGLRCAHKDEPLGVEAGRARFSWRVVGGGEGRRQTAYQVRVGRDADDLARDSGGLWDSGLVESGGSTDVAYGGPLLGPARRYHWKVRVWDEAGRGGPWSAGSWFETALDRAKGWRDCYWIGLGRDHNPVDPPLPDDTVDAVVLAMGPAPYLRRTFALDKPVSSARLYATALGIYQLSLNGGQVSDSVLAPGWTDYARRLLYQTYDVTDLIVTGDNVLGAIVADGWACGFYAFDAKRAGAHYARDPQLLAQLVVTFDDGSERRLVTDSGWECSTGALAYADLLMGERRDPAREPMGWDRPGYDSSSWRPVSCRQTGDDTLVADPGPPVRMTEELSAKSVVRAPGGELIVDFGQNIAGWARLQVDGAAGAVIRVRHGEVLAADGSLYVDNLRTARQTDVFVMAGGSEVLEPRFTFHGFRYAEISGLVGELRPGDATACVVHSDTPRTGDFESSSTDVNQLYANIDWGQRGNFLSIPTDCPQRDERLGWLGDAQIFARTAAYNRDVASFFSKWLDDISDAQLPSGAFTDFAPSLGYDWDGAPAWADAGVIVPWTIYKMYGDKEVLERNFEAMETWMGFLAKSNPGRLRAHNLGHNYGDWLAPKGDFTPRELLATAYWAYDATLMADVARAIGRPGEAAKYETLASEVREAFIEAYVSPGGRLVPETQTAYVLALHMGLVPDELRTQAAAHLVDAIAREDWHVATGFVGVGYLMPVLSSNGYSDVAYRVLEQRSFPSWLYTIDRGATTIWERWDGWTEENGFQTPRMNSFNHYSLGSVGEWLYRFVLGIDLAPGAAGFGQVVIRPHPGGSLTSARGAFRSVRGEISTSWARDGSRFTVKVEIPPNVSGSVHVASARPLEVVDGNGVGPVAVADYPGAVGQKEAVFEVGSGSYSFSGPELVPGAAAAHS